MRLFTRFPSLVPLVLLGFVFISRADAEKTPPLEIPLKNAEGVEVGKATLTEKGKGVKVSLEAKGLPPGKLGIHFHEKGECAAPGFESAGEHFNPEGKEHGRKAKHGPHAGDLKNIKVDEDGTVKTDLTQKHATLRAGANSLRKPGGTALIIHAKEDDEKSQPSGNSGSRIVCGVIPAL